MSLISRKAVLTCLLICASCTAVVMIHKRGSSEASEEAIESHSGPADTGSPGERTFLLFPKLPSELRLKIWHLSIQPRVLVCGPKARPRVPATLQVNRESRGSLLRHYQIHYWQADKKNRVYFNVELDTLLCLDDFPQDMGSESEMERIVENNLSWLGDNPALSQIRHLSLSMSLMMYIHEDAVNNDVFRRIRRSKELKTLSIVDFGASATTPEPRLVEDDKWALENEIVMFWSLGVHDYKSQHPEWNAPELIFMRVEDE